MTQATDRNIGIFEIAQPFVQDSPELVRRIMGKCSILRCELMYESDSFHYLAISPEFDAIPNGARAPRYRVVISDDGADITFVRDNEGERHDTAHRP